MVGLNRRFHPSVILAKQLVDQRGPTVQIVGEFHKSMTVLETSTRFEHSVLDNTLAMNNIHSVDLVCALAGSSVVKVHSFVRRALHKNRDVLGALILFENGCVAQLVFNHTSGSRLERYEIHGRDISVYLEGMGGTRIGETLQDVGVVFMDNKRENMPEPATGGTEEEIRYFIECIKQDNPVGPRADSALLAPNLDEALKSMKLVDAILEGDIP
jgi:predicted dehydrogenase